MRRLAWFSLSRAGCVPEAFARGAFEVAAAGEGDVLGRQEVSARAGCWRACGGAVEFVGGAGDSLNVGGVDALLAPAGGAQVDDLFAEGPVDEGVDVPAGRAPAPADPNPGRA